MWAHFTRVHYLLGMPRGQHVTFTRKCCLWVHDGCLGCACAARRRFLPFLLALKQLPPFPQGPQCC